MTAQFNIKDAETIRLARDLADRTGRSVTATIREALEREHAARREEREAYVQGILDAAARLRAKIPPQALKLSSREWMDAIYDEDGLPE